MKWNLIQISLQRPVSRMPQVENGRPQRILRTIALGKTLFIAVFLVVICPEVHFQNSNRVCHNLSGMENY
jgi:hypothetical protein